MAQPVLIHRMALNFSARARGDSLADLISEHTDAVTRPRVAA
jgi:MoxR-like ATPase